MDAERGCLRQGGRNLPKAAIHYDDSDPYDYDLRISLLDL